jgi:arsenate reductase
LIDMKRVLFVCVENACRSQMAQGFARSMGGADVEAWSAGSKPAPRVNPDAVRLMAEKGVRLAEETPKSVAEVPAGEWDAVVTMGCGDACPTLPAKKRLDWALPDPKTLPDPEFRAVRDEIERRVAALLAEI